RRSVFTLRHGTMPPTTPDVSLSISMQVRVPQISSPPTGHSPLPRKPKALGGKVQKREEWEMRLPVNARRGPDAASTRRRVVLLGFATAATAAATVAAMAAGGVASAATQDEAAIRDAGTAATVPDSFVV